MHKKFDHKEIEAKWQKVWHESGIYNVGDRKSKEEKEYVLVEWPYPSGNLHIGHWYAFAVPDIYVRYQRMQGKQVLFPIGFDAFGLPAENAAIKRNLDPKEWTNENIAYMKTQLGSMGNAFSWDKTTSSTDPDYYKWTQWMFTQFFENDIAYKGKGIVNWCPSCNTVLANEQVQNDDTCERCDSEVEKKQMDEWKLRITNYADQLIDDLEPLDWPEHIKEAQRQWIGRSNGAEIDFKLSTGEKVSVFTTRPDTLYGATYMVLAPEHTLVKDNKDRITNWDEVSDYITASKKKAEQDRLDATKEKTGVKLEGVTATNPANGEEIPVFIADYVLANYGTGAIMAVPAHDERDFAFAQKFGLAIKPVVAYVAHELDEEVDRIGRPSIYGLITNEKDEYLLQYFKNRDFYWLPGGGMEKEDGSEEECLRRELAEETGYEDFETGDRITDVFFEYIGRDGTKSRKRTVVYKINIDSNIEPAPTHMTDEEIEDELELRWISKAELAEKLQEGDRFRAKFIHYVIDQNPDKPYCGTGRLINSEEFDEMHSEEAKVAITKKVGGRMTNTYKLRNWSIGRQRYWGVPIPIVYDPEGKPHSIPKEHLPWTLPEDVDFRPTGEPPLAKSRELKERTEKIFGEGWMPEVETMDTFVDSSWYFLRYIDNENDQELSSKKAQKEWMPIDIYFGGAEHTTMHLLYSRFWQKALCDLGLAEHTEPYTKRINRSLILGPDGNKMSKSKGNVIDPDEQVGRLGADTVKMYLAFMGPYGESGNYPFDLGGIAGIRRFLERVYGLSEHITDSASEDMMHLLHKTIKKIGEDISEYKFNTAVSALMIFTNAAEKQGLDSKSYRTTLQLLAPFAPHITEELWSDLGEKDSIHTQSFPEYDEGLAADQLVTIGVQINGKVRGTVDVAPEAPEDVVMKQVRAIQSIVKYIGDQEVIKVIYVPGKIINLIIQ